MMNNIGKISIPDRAYIFGYEALDIMFPATKGPIKIAVLTIVRKTPREFPVVSSSENDSRKTVREKYIMFKNTWCTTKKKTIIPGIVIVEMRNRATISVIVAVTASL